jgi:hypothetical protein
VLTAPEIRTVLLSEGGAARQTTLSIEEECLGYLFLKSILVLIRLAFNVESNGLSRPFLNDHTRAAHIFASTLILRNVRRVRVRCDDAE